MDLAACASEPIRVPGAIQPHGWMVALGADDLQLLAYSENWRDLVGDADLPASLAALLPALLTPVQPKLRGLPDTVGPAAIGSVSVAGRRLDMIAHRSAARVFVEFEPAVPDDGLRAPLYTLVRQFVPLLQQATSVEALCALAAEEIQRLTGFGRTLVYRFDAEGHGEVLAETIEPGYESYAGHRFPASDVPAQARELYLQNRIRLIASADYVPVPLRSTVPDAAQAPLDLSFAALRSVSPVHLEYMRNMGTAASMSVSVVVRGRLWGLISCHDHAPRFVSFQTRVACEHLGQLLSLQIEAKEDNAEVADRLELRRITLDLVSQLTDSDATLQQLVREPASLLRIARAGGAAVVLDESCWMVGKTPPPPEVLRLAQWLASRIGDVFHTDRLPEAYPAAGAFAEAGCGVLAVSISKVHRHLLIWFRPEMVQTIEWAGDPRKQPVERDGQLHPRRSFATWREQVRGRSLAWRGGEVAAALELRQALVGIVLRRAEELAELAGELGRVNKELEAFSYSVSHDLRAPMRHIAGYVDLVLELEGGALSERTRRYLDHVKGAAKFAGELVDALLDFSRMGRAALKPAEVDLDGLVHDLVQQLSSEHADRRIEWHIEQPLPRLWADPVFLQMAARNLIGNAVKYTRGRDPAVIRIRGAGNDRQDGFEVADNGVGFSMKYANKLFGVFQRLHTAEEFEGSGIGLANVRRVVERHGGSVSARGEPDVGAAFTILLPRSPSTGVLSNPVPPGGKL
ncbi:histidine kinase [Caldimonas brevitalea]|uniref:histidine kinase n=1 Tax=Caldimonas brevitalea TaxID=413882 RepID=A0A0G3BIF3_9BURK|nr:histidine kinase [Caldimonas brevitalea]